MSKPWIAAASVPVACVLTLAGPSFAGVVHPGETVVVSDLDLTMPEGAVLAQSVLPFAIEYEAGAGGTFVEFGGTTAGTLTSTVVRDGQTGTLVFVYDVDFAGDAGADASEASVLTVDGFGAFATDVTGALDYESAVLASRTDDASAVRLSSDDAGLGGAPKLVVRTDATDFTATGTARFFAGDELAVQTPDGLSFEFAAGTADLAGTFRPAAEDEGGNGGGGTPIPLPPAVWSGLAALGTMAMSRAVARLRRRRYPE